MEPDIISTHFCSARKALTAVAILRFVAGETGYARVASTAVAGVYRVRGSIKPWNDKDADREKAALLAYFAARYPYCALWLNEINDNAASELEEFRASGSLGAASWFTMPSDAVVPLLKKLSYGAWGMFFFRNDFKRLLKSIETLPADAKAIMTQLTELHAVVGIVSWYDDFEWLVGMI